MRWFRRPEPWVFVTLMWSYAYFWQARDWNSATRLMLTYAIVDRGTIKLDGLEDQTHDRAYFEGHFYTDKLPGFSLLAAIPYYLAKSVLHLPAHPLNARGFAYWPSDYLVTLGTSALFTALIGAILASMAVALGCGPRRAALVGLTYGLATPAYNYATVSHAHQATALALLASFLLLWRHEARRTPWTAGLAGFLASYAALIELHAALASAILGLYLIAQVVGGRRRPSAIADFAIGAVPPLLVLLLYNYLAFGSPLDVGYFHLTTRQFAAIHSARNPLGLGRPNFGLVRPLLFTRFRGLLFYAPVVTLVPFGLVALGLKRQWGVLVVSSAVMAAFFLVNLSYPEWTGGWTTGPRFLVPLLPFAMLPVAGLLSLANRTAAWLVVAFSLSGGVLMLLFVGAGGQFSQVFKDPLFEWVLPTWFGAAINPLTGESLTRNAFGMLAPRVVARLNAPWVGLQFLPLVVGQTALICATYFVVRPAVPGTAVPYRELSE